MTKPKSTTKAATRSASRKSSKFKSRKRPAPAPSKPAARPATKHARIIAMLRTPTGATIASIVTATEWQQHSVRGFLAGVVRKKLGLNLVSEQTDKGRVSTKTSLEDEIAQLRVLDLGGLRARWQSVFQRSAPAHLTRHLLFAVIAYRLQADRFGDLDHETK